MHHMHHSELSPSTMRTRYKFQYEISTRYRILICPIRSGIETVITLENSIFDAAKMYAEMSPLHSHYIPTASKFNYRDRSDLKLISRE